MMEDIRELSEETQCIHASLISDETGTVVTPIYQTSTFSFESVDQGADLFAGRKKGYVYTRMANPTVESVENAVAVLEEGYKGLGCASGMAAIHTALTATLKAGDHVICSDSVYGPTNTLLTGLFTRFGVSVSFVDSSDLTAVANAFKSETAVVYIESPGNPTLVISDITAIAELAHKHNAKLIVDNTFMSPLLQKPLVLGADVVVHSMTKYLNGHADVVAGMIVVKEEEEYGAIRKVLNQIGGVIDPFNSFLVARGIKTLSIRLEKSCENAVKIAEFLENHPKVDKLFFPWFPSHPQHEVARRQMKGPGGMISIELKGGVPAGKTLMKSVKLHALAVSLGGVESLIQHPASMTHASMGPEARVKAGISDGLVRISVGIESADELIADLAQGLDKI